MSISFKYKTIKRPDGTDVKTPSIPILLYGKEKISTLGILDSGADISAIPLSIAKILGLDLSGRKKSSFGIGGKVDSKQTTMGIKIEKGHERYLFRIPVMVILEENDFGVLLGRLGFFDKFKITFNQSRERVSLKRITRGF